jgi:hypothetical protein
MSDSLLFSHHKTSHQTFELMHLLFPVQKRKRNSLLIPSLYEGNFSIDNSIPCIPKNIIALILLNCYHHSKHKIPDDKKKIKKKKERRAL